MDCISFETRESSLSTLLMEECVLPHGATTTGGDASPRRRPRDPVDRHQPAPDGRRAVAHPAEVAAMTVQTLQRTIPPAMPGVTFLSGGISEEDASIYLDEINKIDRLGPWALTFSFSRAMQSSCIKILGGKPENKEKAQAQLPARAQANSEASKGEYKAGSQPSIEESLYVKDYSY